MSSRHLLWAVLLFLLFFVASPAHAGDVGFSVNPPVIEALLSPNKTASTTITLTNEGDDTAFSLSLHRLVPTDSFGHSTIDPTPLSQTPSPLAVSVQDKDFSTVYPLKAHGSIHLTLNLTSASFVEATDFYMALVIRAESPDELLSASTTTPGLSVPLLITLTPVPAIPTDIVISKFELPSLHDTSLPLTVTPTLENKSPIMLHVKGNYTLTSPNNKVVSSEDFTPVLILGKTPRTLSPFTFSPTMTTIGPYRLKLTVQTEGGRILLESEKALFFAPLRLLLFILTLCLLFVAIFLRHKRLTPPTQSA